MREVELSIPEGGGACFVLFFFFFFSFFPSFFSATFRSLDLSERSK